MEPENFQKENNNHTLTNILLFLVLLVMVTILFLMVKNQKKENTNVINVPVEEITKSNTITNPLTGNSLPLAESDNELVVGQEYPLIFGSVGSTPAIYCGVKEYTSPYETPQNFMIFSRGTSCVPGEINTIGLSLTHFDVELKS